MKRNHLRLSVSRLNRYLLCPAQDYYTAHPDVPRRTDYALLRGKEIHGHINFLHRPLGESSEPRPFYYKTKFAAFRQWFRRWDRALAENAEKLIRPNEEEAERHGKIGAQCVSSYWDSFYGWPQPLTHEQPYSYPIFAGVTLSGQTDQEREVSIPWIKAHRPDIVEGDRLIFGYDPVVIVDFKSNYENYDPYRHLRQSRREITLQDQVLWQLPLHLDLQATTYTWLYHMARRHRPVGFIWWHMLKGASFFTYRTDEDYKELELVVRHVVAGISANSYPRHPSSYCRQCLVYDACWGERPFLVASTEYFPRGSALELRAPQEAPNMVKRVTHQIPLKLWVRRRAPEKSPIVLAKPSKAVMLGSAPRHELQNVQLDLK